MNDNYKQMKQDDELLVTSTVLDDSADNLHTVGILDVVSNEVVISEEDDKIKQTIMNNLPCHPVALIVREYVPNYDNVDSHYNDETLIKSHNNVLQDYEVLDTSTIHISSVDNLHEVGKANNTILDDDNIKRTIMNNLPCHPVALVVREYVPNYDSVDSHYNNETLIEIHNEELQDYEVLDTSNIHERSVDNMHEVGTANSTILDDDKIKGTIINAPCHPVALVVREYGPYYNNVEVNNNNETLTVTDNEIIHEDEPEPTVVNINYRKNRIIMNNDDPNQRIPGAVQVTGIIRRSLSDSSSQLDNTSVTIMENSESLYVTDGDLAPIELLERVDAVPWVDKPGKDSNKKTRNEQQVVDNLNMNFIRRLLLTILILVIMSAIVTASVYVVNGRTTNNYDIPITNNNNSITNQNNTVKYQSFDTKQELINAVDAFILGQNATPSITEIYGNITDWDVSRLQDFSRLFDAVKRNNLHRNFNEDVSRWDVSSATNMSRMFRGAGSFRGDLSKWNVSKVVDMSYFMSEANIFDSNLSAWDKSQIMNASGMFYLAKNFSGNGLEVWNTCNIKDTSHMFSLASSFRGNLSKLNLMQIYQAGMFPM